MPHPIVDQMLPSSEQRPAIEARGRDVVVTAGAGAGKTRTLVARYLALLAEGLPLRSIVAITFTKKAAREMRNRIRDEVRRYIDQPDLDAAERERWQDRYGALDAARIDTIHGLCTEILRAHPAEAGVDPRFEVLDEAQASLLRSEVVDQALAWTADDPEATGLFNLLGESGLRSVVDTLLQKRLDVQQASAALPADVAGHWKRIVLARQAEALDALVNGDEWRDAVDTLRSHQARAATDLIETQRRLALAIIDAAVGSAADRVASLSRLESIKLIGGSAKSWPGGKDQLDEVKDALKQVREWWKALPAAAKTGWTPLDDRLAEMLPQLKRVFDFALDRYATLKRERDALDFDDLEDGALRLMQANAAVRARWASEARAILVDEYQDTNARQRDLVNLLNGGGGKLFIVGDAKQSIYRFRGADVSVFRAERDRIEQQGGSAVSLATSYRAHRDLIAGLNDLLGPLLGERADPARPWVEPFSALQHDRVSPGPGFTAPHIELHLAVGSKSEGALERAADALCARVAALMNAGTQVAERGKFRALRYDDVAILCRASTSFGAYEDALERAGIPFLTVAGRGFYDRPEVRDVFNALQAIADPTDDLALAGLLRSPAFGLSDAGLYRLSQRRKEMGKTISMWNALHAGGAALPDDDGPRAARAAAVIAQLHAQAGRAPVADLLKAFLDATGYRAALIAAGQNRGARNIGKLLGDAHASGIVTIGEFLDYVAHLRDSGAREGEARATAEGAVQIMSVHAAKGLEFPIVAIGDVTYTAPSRDTLLVDPDLGILIPLEDDDGGRPGIYALAKTRLDDQEAAESDRLLYVAATRAREQLIISGCASPNANGQLSRLAGWLGRIVEAHDLAVSIATVTCDPAGANIIRLDWPIGRATIACSICEPNAPNSITLPAAEQATPSITHLPPPLLAPIAAAEEHVDRRTSNRERASAQRVWRVVPPVAHPRAPAWVVGSLVHESLAAWRFPDGGYEAWAVARARGYGLTDEHQLADAVRESSRLLRRFQAHPLYRDMNTAVRRLHEVPYSVLVDGSPQNGIIDALYLQGEMWTIVEFKTDTVRDPAELETLLHEEDYLQQAARYISAVEQLAGRPPRSLLCLLDYSDAVRIEEVSNP